MTGSTGASVFGVIEKSSMARPSSAPEASASTHRIQNVEPLAMLNPVIV
jgi:hypothetical protein